MKFFTKGFSQARLIFTVGLTTLVLVFGIISYDRHIGTLVAGGGHNMSGWAWSDTIGWISFNSLNDGSAYDYGVNVAGGDPDSEEPLTGDMSGYAWSDNIGWISFNCAIGGECFAPGENSFPAGSEFQGPARVTANKMTGWARACSVFSNANGCSGPLAADDIRGGWDGWISLSGLSPAYGIEYSPLTKKFGDFNDASKTYAWGDTNIGWINFQPRQCAEGEDPSLCGVILGSPRLGISCIVDDYGVTVSGMQPTWTAIPRGGSGNYSFSWTPTVSNCDAGATPLSGASGRVMQTTCTNGGTSPVVVNATVTVSDGVNTPVTSASCANVRGGTGVVINQPQAGFTVQTNKPVDVSFAGGLTSATTTPFAIVTVVPFAPPNPDFDKDVTLRKAYTSNPDYQEILSRLGLADSDIVFQWSRDISNPAAWNAPQDNTLKKNGNASFNSYSQGVSLMVHFKKKPKVNGIFQLPIRGEGSGGSYTAHGYLTVRIEGAKSSIKEK